MAKAKPANYVNNKELYAAMCEWKEALKTDESAPMPDVLAVGIMKVSNNLSRRYNFSGYTANWRDEMVGDGIETCLKYIKNFNTEKYNNIHAYITQICYNAFIQRIKKERKANAVRYKYFLQDALDYEDEEGEHRVDYEFITQMMDRVADYETPKDKKEPASHEKDNPMGEFYG